MPYRQLEISDKERDSILKKYISPYEGNIRLQNTPNTQQLNVQSYANDKNGITLNNKNEVSGYKNHNINKQDGK